MPGVKDEHHKVKWDIPYLLRKQMDELEKVVEELKNTCFVKLQPELHDLNLANVKIELVKRELSELQEKITEVSVEVA
jgi:hypothetical protein